MGTVAHVCGIAGGTGHNTASQQVVIGRQLATLDHRGPDAAGFSTSPTVVIGQTRLAVMDPAHGDPPMTDESGDVRVALNGEIYNFLELRAQLQDQGHRFRSACDTEVLAHLAESLEPVDLARALRGMFAFAVWDERRGRLILGRDRLGKKPLYFWTGGGDLVFGSEIKAVLADPRVPRELDRDVIPAYLAFGYAPSPRTFFDGVQSVPPGSVLVWERGSYVVESYWDCRAVSTEELLTAPVEELAREAGRLFAEAVRERLVADVPLGAFLSGGIDSSAVVAVMADAASGPVRTFCIGFNEDAYDERRWARLVSDRFSTEHVEELVKPDASAALDTVLDHCDQPFADSSALPMHLLAGVARQHVTVALSGDGGDEVFGGYERFAASILLNRVQKLPTPLRAGAAGAGRVLQGGDQRGLRSRAGRLLRGFGKPMPDAYEELVRYFDDEWLTAARLSPQRDVHAAEWFGSAGAPVLGRLLDLNRRTYLLDDLLVKVDRMSMAHALEVRSPFLDHRLVEFAARVPGRHHVHGRRLKVLLKLAMRGTLPDEVLDRPKRGFGVPLDAWFRGPLRDETHRRLLDRTARVAAFVPAEQVSALVREHDAGKAAHGQRLWSLLMLERFLEREGW
jgi:asparagine synthase (glutamine-hydrolysing)